MCELCNSLQELLACDFFGCYGRTGMEYKISWLVCFSNFRYRLIDIHLAKPPERSYSISCDKNICSDLTGCRNLLSTLVIFGAFSLWGVFWSRCLSENDDQSTDHQSPLVWKSLGTDQSTIFDGRSHIQDININRLCWGGLGTASPISQST